jgi:hypothetical protein
VDACGHVTTCQAVTVTVTTATAQIGVLNSGAFIYITAGTFFYIAGANGNYWNYANCSGSSHAYINNSGTVEVFGSWNNNDAGSNVFTTNAGTTSFLGTAQTINGTTSTYFNNLTLNNTSTTLNVNTTAGGGFAAPAGTLTLTNGALILNSNTLTVTNPLTTAIGRTNGYIESETYNNGSSTAAAAPVNTCTSLVQWNIGTAGAGNTFIIPFGTVGGTYIPFSAAITTAGTGSGDLLVSTYHTSALNYPYPGSPYTVANMHNLSGADNSANCIKRFWSVNLNSYTATPTATLTFYLDAVNDNPSALSVPGLFAQYWSAANKWVIPGIGIGTAPNYVNAVTGVNFSGEWVLVNSTNPLPVELLNFSASCLDDKIKLLWTTASESNNDYFSIDRSQDNNSWEFVTRLNGAGNSNSIINYISYDDFPYVQTLLGNMPAYYRMKQVDFNGNSKLYGPITVSCAEAPGIDFDIVNIKTNETQSELAITYTAPTNGERITACLFNMVGQQLMQQEQISSTGNNTIEFSNISLSRGVYLIRLDNTEKFITRKIIIP